MREEVRHHIDRQLAKWELYAYRNGNFLKKGTYGWATGATSADCWWRRRVPGGPRRGGGGCTFCSWTSMLPTWSVRPVDDYLDELEQLVDLGVEEVFDDTGTFPAGRWLTDFCTGFRERGLHKVLMMGCNMRADALSQAEYEMLGASNFRFILYGIESANQRTLDLLNKGTTVRQQWESVKWASEAGLEPHVTCMVGYPWETYRGGQADHRLHPRDLRPRLDQHAAGHHRHSLPRHPALRASARERLAAVRRSGALGTF